MTQEKIYMMIFATVSLILVLVAIWSMEINIKSIEKTKRVRLLRFILSEFVARNSYLGICEVMAHMFWRDKFPNEQDYKSIKDYIDSHKPKEGDEFFDEHILGDSGFWWPITNDGRETRIKFLNYLISKNI